MATAGHVRPGGLTTSAEKTWTRVRGTLRIIAARVAQRTAFRDVADPSTPTTTPEFVVRLDISLSFSSPQNVARLMPMTLNGRTPRIRSHWSLTRVVIWPFSAAEL